MVKSEILTVGRVDNVDVLVAELGCEVGFLPSSYLGLHLVAIITWRRFGILSRRGSERV